MTVTARPPATTLTAKETLAALRERGYTLVLHTRVEEFEAKVGVMYLTVADTLHVSGPAAPPDYLREAMHCYATELKAAVAVLDPPVEWLAELVRRYQAGQAHRAKRDGQFCWFPITLDILCANLCGFLGLDPIADVEMIRDIVAEALRARKEAV